MAAYAEDVGRRIRQARETNRPELSQEAAAHEVGVSVKQYGRWERGESSPRHDKWERLADVLGVPVNDIRGEPPAVAEHELRIQLNRIEEKLDLILAALTQPVEDPVQVAEEAAQRKQARRTSAASGRAGKKRSGRAA